jgi:DNA-directed RNA polymerase specialized sigma24 family protein
VVPRDVHQPGSAASRLRDCDRYYTEIHGYVARRLGPGLADDVAAETFLVAFDRRDRYDAAYPFARPWLYGIASNLVSRHRRAEVRQYRALAHGRVRRGAVAVRPGTLGREGGPADAAGRPAIALGRIAEGWLHEEVLIAPKSYAYRPGQRLP